MTTPSPLSGRKMTIFLLLRKVCKALSYSGVKLLRILCLLYEHYVCYMNIMSAI